MPPSGDTHIQDHLPYLSQPGRIFKTYNFDNTCTPDDLGEISSQIPQDTRLERERAHKLLKNIALDKDLQKGIWIALDEGSKIFMVAEKNLYYEIKIEEKQLPCDVQWEYNEDLEMILSNSLDKEYREQGVWVNPPPVTGARALILTPHLGGNFDDAIFLDYNPSVQDARNQV
ncbi:hypothetical protein PISL3812_09949 [Talaromyces islandicus]|uniref:Uncharacterized protein n=1 Tax=Talaromyces islandicus TaxID=28573 RepID=A0A0U1MB86_TALIS|nr:hypothetical protein PISL3812_09949 [Talaromyces islandicus]